MDYRPTTRYRSLSMAADEAANGAGPTLIDGLDVVDEQVLVPSPIDVERTPRGRRPPTPRRDVRVGMG